MGPKDREERDLLRSQRDRQRLGRSTVVDHPTNVGLRQAPTCWSRALPSSRDLDTRGAAPSPSSSLCRTPGTSVHAVGDRIPSRVHRRPSVALLGPTSVRRGAIFRAVVRSRPFSATPPRRRNARTLKPDRVREVRPSSRHVWFRPWRALQLRIFSPLEPLERRSSSSAEHAPREHLFF